MTRTHYLRSVWSDKWTFKLILCSYQCLVQRGRPWNSRHAADCLYQLIIWIENFTKGDLCWGRAAIHNDAVFQSLCSVLVYDPLDYFLHECMCFFSFKPSGGDSKCQVGLWQLKGSICERNDENILFRPTMFLHLTWISACFYTRVVTSKNRRFSATCL